LIEYISNEKIDFKKWDKCIKKAFNGNIFAYSWYLNIVSRKWNALVEDDYERVMPLPQSLLAGNEIIIHPKLAGQLGIFSTSTLNEFHLSSFVNSIPDDFRYINLKLNKHNQIQESFKKAEKKINLDIDLIKSYDKLREIYPDLFKELLEAAYKNDFRVATQIPIDLIAQFEQKKSPLHTKFHPEELITLQLLIAASINNKMGQLCGLYCNNELLALAFFVWSHQKATLAFCLSNNKKMQLPAFFFLIDDFIRNNSEKNLILHFEINSNSKLISAFERIGAKKSESFYLYRNQLPWYLKPFVT
jgi:hypothetical protein